MDLIARIGEIERLLANIVIEGVIDKVNPKTRKVVVSYGTAEHPQYTAWLPVKPFRAGKAVVWWFPEVGEAATIISPGGNTLIGKVYPGGYQDDFPAPSDDPDLFLIQFGDDAAISYQRQQHELKIILPDGGKTTLISKGGVNSEGDWNHKGNLIVSENVTVDKNVTVTQDLSVKQSITAKQDITADGQVSDGVRTMLEDRTIYNTHIHPVGAPNTATPMQPQ